MVAVRGFPRGQLAVIAPVFAVGDIGAVMAHCQGFGFTVRACPGGGCGFACREGVEVHRGVVPGGDRRASSAAAWLSAGAEVHPPRDTGWGEREGAVAGPGGHVIGFGSPRLLSC